MKQKAKLLFYLFPFFCICAHAQEIWTGGTIRFKNADRINTEFTQQLRLADETFKYHSTLSEIGARFKVNPNFGVKGNYRYVLRPNENRQRWNGDVFLNLGADEKTFSSSVRVRYQETYKLKSEEAKEAYIRGLFLLNYNLTKTSLPYASTELFYRADDKNELRLVRLTFGLITKLTKKLSFNTFYRIENELNVKFPERYHIVGLLVTYTPKLKNAGDKWDKIENNKEE